MLITYPDAHNLSGCSQPIRMFTTYSACAPGEVTIAATWAANTQPIRVHAGRSAPKGHPEHWAECRVIVGEGAAGVSRLPVSAPRIQVAECTTGVLASHAVIRNLVGRGQLNEAGALSSVARALWWDPWAPKRCDTAPRSSYRLVSMATRQPVVPQILKE